MKKSSKTVSINIPAQREQRIHRREINGEEVIRISIENPETKVGVKSSRIYAQIAKTGRNPELISSRAKLIEVLSDSRTINSPNGKVKLKSEPVYVPMKVKDVKACFGKGIKKMPKASFIEMVED